ncbi:hypothetical protein [Methylobacterium aquaticum]|uniref:hypothetical protein n=1 Tax=Methylobacterium aquaticum TaxID=270351 RepID=UPI001931D7C5|nr:hypothetical protein [Methylobacterium aquaticum]QRE76828.1 AAA family ATPase [Methylobacterium aquaticum]
MSPPDIDFKSIRLHRGVQSDAFEELCCQLASDEAKALKARFIRKGKGADGGVEAFAVLPTGREIGWQVKYYWNIDAALKSLTDSLATALATHPAMDRFIACIPFDPADGRRAKTTSALEKWEAWRKSEIAGAAAKHRMVEIELWPAQSLRDRLVSDARAAGRIAFWFDETLLTEAWFAEKYARAMKSLGARYTPSTNVKLPIRHAILALTGARAFLAELRQLTADLAQARSRAPDTAGPRAGKACGAVDAALAAMQAVIDNEPDDLPQVELAALLANAELATSEWRQVDELQSSPDISRLLGRVADAHERLTSRRWSLVNARLLLVTGEGGRGKSHLLADACQHQIDAGNPAILILSHLLRDEDPWLQIVASLDLPRHLRVEEFLGALNSAAQAAGVRALVAIDGINERGGQTLWSSRLAGFLHDVQPYPWISVVLSCRTTYLDATIPVELDEAILPRLEHTGFSISDAARYLDMRGVTTLDAPWPLAEFDTPLFLKTLCDGLALSGGTTLPKGSQGISTIFDLYAKAVAGAVQRDMELTPKLAYVPRLIAALADEIGQTGNSAIPYVRADEIAVSILPHDGRSKRDLLFQLIAAGLLATDLYDKYGEVVRFTFERFGDFAVAEGLIRGCLNANDLKARLTQDSALKRTLTGDLYCGGVLEALAVMAPERFGIELLDLPIPRRILWEASHAFSESLMTREATAFTDHTWELIRQQGGANGEWDARIRLASEPEAAQNAEALHARLKALLMPERDAGWSVHLAQSSGAASQLIDWAVKPRSGVLAEPRALLVAITLTWFLSTSHRGLRDRATKALVAVLADMPGIVAPLMDRFIDIDDGYVTERLVCAIYGAALQGRWIPDAAAQAVQAVDQALFIKRPPPVNCLTREHGRLLIRWAIVHGVVPADYDDAPSRGPFSSPWPIEHVPDTVIDGFTRIYAGGHVGRDSIVASCVKDGDFARYVLDRAVDAWSPARRGTSPLPTREMLYEAWQRDFEAEATSESRAAYLNLTEALAEDYRESRWHEGSKAAAAKAAFAAAAGPEMYERWREEAENWRRGGMYQRHQPREYAEFNLAWARRWVCLRAHELGWSQTLHGDFDDTIHNDRMSHHAERIGKKYQWLALYELRARMADNLEPTKPEAGAEPDELRAIDPSLLAGTRFGEEADPAYEVEGEMMPLTIPEWTRSIVLPPVALADALIWRDDLEDLPDGLDGLEIMMENQPWLVLKGFDSWRGGPESLNRQLSRWVTCFVVRRKDLAAFLKLVDGKLELDHDHILEGEERVRWRSYLGEHPWLWGEETVDGWNRPWMLSERRQDKELLVRGTTIGYLAEERSYDQSLAMTVEASLPRPWLMQALDLRLGDGRAIAYVDRNGRTLFRDPTAEGAATTTALIDRMAFLDLLAREGLAAVWLIAGEKNVYGGRPGDGFGGRRYYARVAHTTGGPLTLRERVTRLDSPSSKQLRALGGF